MFFLLRCFSLSAPVRVIRPPSLLSVPYARVVTVKDGLFVRAPRLTTADITASSHLLDYVNAVVAS